MKNIYAADPRIAELKTELAQLRDNGAGRSDRARVIRTEVFEREEALWRDHLEGSR